MLRGLHNKANIIFSNMTNTQRIIGVVIGISLIYVMKDTNLQIPLFCLLAILLGYLILGLQGSSGSQSGPIETIIRENNQIKKKTIYLNPELDEYLQKLRRYKRYNRTAYTEGKKYITIFMSHLHDLMRDDIAHPRQVFENAQLSLTLALNHFHSIHFSIPENNYNSTLKYNKTISHKLVQGLSDTCKGLYSHCHSLLVSISEALNVDFRENPNMYKSGIVLTPDNVRASNEVSSQEIF